MKCKLSEIAAVKGGKRLPKGVNLISTPNAHPYIRVRDLNGQRTLELNDEYEFVDEETQKKIARYIVKKGDIVLSIVGTIGLVSIVGESLDNANLTENCVKIIVSEAMDSKFLYYYLKSSVGQTEIMQRTVGAVQAKLPIKNIQDIDVWFPPKETQTQIASVLSCIDDKIEHNNKINANLQQQAQAIFKSWFVDFEPWGGEKPSTWIDAPLGTFVEIKRGGSPRPIKDFLADNGLRWLKISDVTSLNSPFVLDIKEHIKKEGLRKTVYLNVGELVLSNSATPGIPKILDVDSCIHDGWLYFPKSQFSKYWLYLFFLYIRKKLVALGNGSVFTNLKTDILKAYMVMKPTEDILAKFDEIVTPMFAAMLNCDRENARLASLRDNLLPKLMNGEIEIDGI